MGDNGIGRVTSIEEDPSGIRFTMEFAPTREGRRAFCTVLQNMLRKDTLEADYVEREFGDKIRAAIEAMEK